MNHELIDGSVYFPKQSILCMSDLHLGYEAELRAKGVQIPSTEYSILKRRIGKILSSCNPKIIVLNGDVKHSFGRISDDEWRQVREVLELFSDSEIIIVKGNHDVMLEPVTRKMTLSILSSYVNDGILFLHGDEEPKDDFSEIHTIVIGHVHPAITISRGPRSELVKCYLRGQYKGRDLVVLPSMFSLTEGVDVLDEPLNTPLVDDVDSFLVDILVDGLTMNFGTVRDVRNLNES